MQKSIIENIKQELATELPGKNAQYMMAPSDRMTLDMESKETAPRLSAVLILLFFKENEPYILLAQRANYKGPHGGQISFPGGKFDSKHDQNLEDTVKRETLEEVLLDASHYEIIGQTSSLNIPASNTIAHPFVAITENIDLAKPDQYEIVDLYQVPIKHLLNSQNIKWTESHRFKYPYYEFNDKEIWGATAMMISEFLEIIRKTEFFNHQEA